MTLTHSEHHNVDMAKEKLNSALEARSAASRALWTPVLSWGPVCRWLQVEYLEDLNTLRDGEIE